MPMTLRAVQKRYFRQEPSAWCSCSPTGACGAWCPAAAGKVLEASIRDKVSLPILKGKVSLQSPNLATPTVFASPDSFGVVDLRLVVEHYLSAALLIQISKSSK